MEALVARLCERVVPPAVLCDVLGDVVQRHAGLGYEIAPRNEGVTSAWVGVRGMTSDREEVTNLTLELDGSERLTLEILARLFGARSAVPPRPRASRYTVAYHVEPTHGAFSVAVFAETDRAPSAVDLPVMALMLRRDRR